MRLLLITPAFILLLYILTACNSNKEEPINIAERFPFVADSVPNFELFARPLKDTSKETVYYELKALNHTNESRKILFYHCAVNYGIRSTGGMIVPQNFECNANIPYFQMFPAHGELKYRVNMDRPTVRNPKFYWRLVVVKQEGIMEDFTIIDTVDLETR